MMFQEFELLYDTIIQTLDMYVTSFLLKNTNTPSTSLIQWLTSMTKSYMSNNSNNDSNNMTDFDFRFCSVKKERDEEVKTEMIEHPNGMCMFVTHIDDNMTARQVIGYDDDSLDDTYWLFADFFPRIALPVDLYRGKVVCCAPSTRSRIVIESGEGMLNYVCVFLKTDSKKEPNI